MSFDSFMRHNDHAVSFAFWLVSGMALAAAGTHYVEKAYHHFAPGPAVTQTAPKTAPK